MSARQSRGRGGRGRGHGLGLHRVMAARGGDAEVINALKNINNMLTKILEALDSLETKISSLDRKMSSLQFQMAALLALFMFVSACICCIIFGQYVLNAEPIYALAKVAGVHMGSVTLSGKTHNGTVRRDL